MRSKKFEIVGIAAMVIGIVANAALAASNLSGDVLTSGDLMLGVFNLGAGVFCAVVAGKLAASLFRD